MNAATISTTGKEATAWHAIAADDVVRRLNPNTETGLDAAEIPRRLAKYGSNRLPEAARRGPFMRFLLQFNNVLVYVLLAAAFVKLMTNLWLDASIILAVVLINALLGFIQEGVPAAGRRRGRGLAGAVHVRAAVASPVRDRSGAAADLAVAGARGLPVLPPGGGGKTDPSHLPSSVKLES